MNKTLKVMTSAALLAGVVAPVAVTTVSANSSNVVSKVPSLDDDYTSVNAAGDGVVAATSIYINEDDVDFTSGDTFRLTLPSGVKWVKDSASFTDGTNAYKKGYFISGGNIQTAKPVAYGFEVVSVTDQDLELRMFDNDGNAAAGFDDNDTKAKVEIPLFFEVDGADNGEVQLTVDGKNSTVTSGKYTIANVSDGATNATIADVETIGDGDAIETIRIDETSIGALYLSDKSEQEVTLKLPSKFEWKDVDTTAPYDNISLGGGFNTGNFSITAVELNSNKDELTVKFKITAKPTSTGTIYFEKLAINADNDASYGEIEVDIDGDEVSSQTLVVADYQEYGTSASLEDDVPTLIAGRDNYDTDDLETVEFEVEELTEGSWLAGRAVRMELPSWVKLVGVDITAAENFDRTAGGSYSSTDIANVINAEIDGDDNVVEFDLPSDLKEDGKKSFKMKMFVSAKADATGDVTVKVDGRAGVELAETVIAKVITPVSVEVTKADVRTGIQAQPVNDIVITENVAGALTEDNGNTVKVWLPEDVEFTADPTVEVVEGNLDIDQSTVNLVDGDSAITFEIDSESTRASKIKISGLKLDLNRSVAEGDIPVKVGGDALVKNDAKVSSESGDYAFGKAFKIGDKEYKETGADASKGETNYLNEKIGVGEFDQSSVVKATIATVVTPAEGNVSAETVTLTIGSSTMKVGDKEVALDAAPFIEASTGRTYLPLRAIANAIGASSVEWDNATRTATVVKDGLVAQMTIGQNQYVLNGAKIGMDGKAQIVSERTFLPIRALGNALGANVEWDAATQTVTIK